MWTIHCCTGVTLEAQIYVESLSEMYDCVYGYGVCLWASAMKCNTLSEIHTLLIVCSTKCLHFTSTTHSTINTFHHHNTLHHHNTFTLDPNNFRSPKNFANLKPNVQKD